MANKSLIKDIREIHEVFSDNAEDIAVHLGAKVESVRAELSRIKKEGTVPSSQLKIEDINTSLNKCDTELTDMQTRVEAALLEGTTAAMVNAGVAVVRTKLDLIKMRVDIDKKLNDSNKNAPVADTTIEDALKKNVPDG